MSRAPIRAPFFRQERALPLRLSVTIGVLTFYRHIASLRCRWRSGVLPVIARSQRRQGNLSSHQSNNNAHVESDFFSRTAIIRKAWRVAEEGGRLLPSQKRTLRFRLNLPHRKFCRSTATASNDAQGALSLNWRQLLKVALKLSVRETRSHA